VEQKDRLDFTFDTQNSITDNIAEVVRFCAVVKASARGLASAERRQVLVGYLFEYFMPKPGKSSFREKTATKPAILKAF